MPTPEEQHAQQTKDQPEQQAASAEFDKKAEGLVAEIEAGKAPILREKKSIIQAGNQGLQLTTMDDMWRFATAVISSGLNPSTLDTPEKCFIAIQMGAEVGLPPMAALQNIAVINKRPAIWGDAMLAIPQARGLVENHTEEEIGKKGEDSYGWRVTTKRVGIEKPFIATFTVADAKRAKLWEKRGNSGGDTPWITYPERMLKLRARGFALRDAYPDALRGMISIEEARDIPPPEPKNVTASMAEELKS